MVLLLGSKELQKFLKKKIQTKYKHSNKQHNKASPPSPPQKISTYKPTETVVFLGTFMKKKMTVDEISGIQFYYNSTSNVSPTIHTS